MDLTPGCKADMAYLDVYIHGRFTCYMYVYVRLFPAKLYIANMPSARAVMEGFRRRADCFRLG